MPNLGLKDPEKAAANLAGLAVETAPLDLQDPASIDSFASKFIASSRPLHLLINNAAIMACPLLRDSRGYELQFATHHLGHFQLTAGLWPALVKANGARVVCVSSGGHNFSDVCEDWNYESRASEPLNAYGQAKTANVLFARALDARGAKLGVRAFALHPGAILSTELSRFQSREESLPWLKQMGFCDADGNLLLDPMRQNKSIPQGASTTVWAATSPLLEGKGGLYLENNNIAPLSTDLVDVDPKSLCDRHGRTGVKDYALDLKSADKLWALSERLTGVTFSI
jgi:NAD(P)-dependent dehydrogenase (short-subunit alcohol dehydrogenase family)